MGHVLTLLKFGMNTEMEAVMDSLLRIGKQRPRHTQIKPHQVAHCTMVVITACLFVILRTFKMLLMNTQLPPTPTLIPLLLILSLLKIQSH